MAKGTARMYLFVRVPMRLSLASELTGIPESTLRDKIDSGDLPAKREGDKNYLIDPASLLDWFDNLPDAKPKERAKKKAGSRGNKGDSAIGQDPLQIARERVLGSRLGV